MNSDASNSLCLECGLCCNGVIFARGQLQPEDDTAQLRALGLRLSSRATAAGERTFRFAQPCAAFRNCRCSIYEQRPRYCRDFECSLLQRVNAGEVQRRVASRTVRHAHRQAHKVKSLLRELGDTDEQVALSLRFRRMKRRIEAGMVDDATADVFGELTLAVHELNLLLSREFYR